MPKLTHILRRPLVLLTLLGLSAGAVGCNVDDPGAVEEGRVEALFNAPGTRAGTERNRLSSEVLVERINGAQRNLDVCIYGFSKDNVIEAVINAHKRGVEVRVVGDARHLLRGAEGYQRLIEENIPIQAGNQFHIMHNKFFVIDGRYTFVGTGNITSTGFGRNNNNWVFMDSIPIAEDFLAEFEQMWEGRFSSAKEMVVNNNKYQVGDTNVEVYFSPQEDGMGVILSELEKAHTSVHFQIFAFTKDQVGSHFINKHRDFIADNAAIDPNFRDKSPVDWPKKVVGILDRSQLHGNGQYHEGYRLQAFGVPMRLDGNENSRLPGDYQAGGGRLHTKTMILDAGTPDARVLTGSFNWSSAATIANDEVLLVLRGERVVEQYMEEWHNLWEHARPVDEGMCIWMAHPRPVCADRVEPGDVVISEVHFDGWNGQLETNDDLVVNDEFVELHNTTDRTINLSMYTLTNGYDFKVGFTPGTVIQPGEYFLVLDHNTVPYSESTPQRGHHAFANPDFVLNMANDPRFPRLNLKNAQLHLELRDAEGQIIDIAGDGGPPFYGGRVRVQAPSGAPMIKNYSMERIIDADGGGDGTDMTRWTVSDGVACPEEYAEAGFERCGGLNVFTDYQTYIIATPGQANE